MSFAQPITQIYHSLFIKNPTGNLNYTAFIDPFYWTTWLFLIIFIMLTSPFLYFGAKYEAIFLTFSVLIVLMLDDNFILRTNSLSVR